MTVPLPAGARSEPRRAELQAALDAVQARVAAACAAAGRPPRDVVVVAVSKTWPASDIALLRDLGVREFGENRDQEAAGKAALVPGVRWHAVGRVQTNKARSVASYCDVVHSLDRRRLADALADGARRADRHVEVLLQVSLDGDPARGGCPPEDLPALAAHTQGLDGLRLAGVMAVAPLDTAPEQAFAQLATLSAQLRRGHPGATWISAGMSGDLAAAVAAGATHLRVGTALFGRRPAPLG